MTIVQRPAGNAGAVLLLVASLCLDAAAPPAARAQQPRTPASAAVEHRVDSILAGMTLAEKAGQLTVVGRDNPRFVELVRRQ